MRNGDCGCVEIKLLWPSGEETWATIHECARHEREERERLEAALVRAGL